MKKLFFISIAFAAQTVSSFALFGVFTSIVDLFSDTENRLEFYEHIESTIFSQNPEYFLYFETDFNNDGNPYLWVSHEKNKMGHGYFFNVYKKVDDHYELLSDYGVFSPELLAFYGRDYGKKDARLLTYSRISGQEGNLVYYNVDSDDKVVGKVYKTIEPQGADAEVFEKLFPEENKFVKEIPRAEMLDFLSKRGIPSPKKDNIEFLAFDLGGKTGVVLLATNPAETKGAAGWQAFNMFRKDTLLNDVNLGFIDVDLSLDNLIPFEVRNPGWKKLEVFPIGRKIIFFRKYSFIREIDKRKFLITLCKEGSDQTTISFYQLSFARVCGFDIADIRIKEDDDATNDDEEKQAYEFIKALDFDYDKDSKYFNYKLYPAKDVVYKNKEITVPKDLDVDDDIYEIKKITLPENNKYTEEFKAKWSKIRKEAREYEEAHGIKNPRPNSEKKAETQKPTPTPAK